MKKLFFFIVLFNLVVLSQTPSWNTTVPTTINEQNVVKMDMFTNRDGNHIVVQNSDASNSIKYYLLNSSGSVVRSATIETSGSAEFPNISGDNNKVYIVYKLGSNLKFRKSTNAGSSWGNPVNQSIGSNTCNGVDIIYDYRGLHIVYALKDNGNDYETYYQLVSNGQWGSIEYVTGYGSEVGGFPTISVSDNRVHVGYNTDNETDPWASLGTAKTRDKYYSSWQDPQTVATGSESSSREKLQVAYGYLIDFFYDQWEYGFAIQFKSRTLSGTTWSSATQINAHCDPIQYMGAETTNNGYLHLIYGDWDLLHKYFNGSTWSTETYISEITDGDVNTTLSSVSNDLFAVWKDYNSNYLKYAQWDDAPLAPQGLAVSIYTVGLNTYPKLTWTLNNEPDVYNQTNAYQIERRYSISGGPWSNWSYLATKNGNEYEFIDWNISGLYAEANTAEYRIRAKDVDNHFSDYSSSVSINFSRFNKFNSGSVLSEYGLKQNYPNPFNPTTTINYSLKTAGEVTLKVYDMLGTEVANLVYERLEAGNYSVEFNASDLPSGMYVYRITAGNFVDTKKLILLK